MINVKYDCLSLIESLSNLEAEYFENNLVLQVEFTLLIIT